MVDASADSVPDPDETEIEAFWALAKEHLRLNPAPGYFGPTTLEALRPDAWAFGATPEHADGLLELVLAGTKTATSTALWEFEAVGEAMPEEGTLSIILDGRGRPRAVLVTTDVRVVPFDQVDAEHARLEGEGDRSLEHWRDVHRRFFSEHASHERGFAATMPVVLERFEVVYPAPEGGRRG